MSKARAVTEARVATKASQVKEASRVREVANRLLGKSITKWRSTGSPNEMKSISVS